MIERGSRAEQVPISVARANRLAGATIGVAFILTLVRLSRVGADALANANKCVV